MALAIYLALFAFSLFWLFRKSRKPAQFPPGPPKLPVVGSLPYLAAGKSGVHVSMRLTEKYGKIWGAYVGSVPMVKIADFDLAKELLAMEEFSGRPTDTVPARSLVPGFGHPNLEKGTMPGIVMSQVRFTEPDVWCLRFFLLLSKMYNCHIYKQTHQNLPDSSEDMNLNP